MLVVGRALNPAGDMQRILFWCVRWMDCYYIPYTSDCSKSRWLLLKIARPIPDSRQGDSRKELQYNRLQVARSRKHTNESKIE